jgi:copper(I)-binding protein
MKSFILTGLIVVLAGFVSACLPQKDIVAKGMIAYQTSALQKNGAVFGAFQNTTDGDLKIVSAASDVADRVELHTHAMDENGVMSRYEVEYYAVPAKDMLTLSPAGHHIMLMGLKAPLAEGESFTVDLTLGDESVMTVPVTIVKAGTQP